MYNLKKKKLEKFWVYGTSSFCNISESQRRFSRNVWQCHICIIRKNLFIKTNRKTVRYTQWHFKFILLVCNLFWTTLDELSIVKAVFVDTEAIWLWIWQLGNHNVTSVRSNSWLIQDWDKHAYMTYINETFVFIQNSLEMFRTLLP